MPMSSIVVARESAVSWIYSVRMLQFGLLVAVARIGNSAIACGIEVCHNGQIQIAPSKAINQERP